MLGTKAPVLVNDSDSDLGSVTFIRPADLSAYRDLQPKYSGDNLSKRLRRPTGKIFYDETDDNLK
jgi:hypothetical protein